MLKGNIVSLRAIEPEDLFILQMWRNKPENRQYFREWRELNSEHQKRWFNDHVMNQASPVMFAIVKKSIVGVCGLTYIDWIHRNAEISIYIGEGYIDDGSCPDALDTLIKYAFNELGLHRLYMQMYEYDHKKQKLAKICGFAYEGTMKHAHFYNGQWHDEYVYGRINGLSA